MYDSNWKALLSVVLDFLEPLNRLVFFLRTLQVIVVLLMGCACALAMLAMCLESLWR